MKYMLLLTQGVWGYEELIQTRLQELFTHPFSFLSMIQSDSS